MDLAAINWVAVVVAAVSAFVLGGLWYGPLFGKRWQAYVGLSDEQLQNGRHPAATFGAAFILTFVQALVLAAIIPRESGIGTAIGQALMIGVAFVATAFGVNYLFSRHPKGLWAIDAGYNVALFAVMGATLGAFG